MKKFAPRRILARSCFLVVATFLAWSPGVAFAQEDSQNGAITLDASALDQQSSVATPATAKTEADKTEAPTILTRALSPADKDALERYSRLFDEALAHPIGLDMARKAAADGKIATVIIEPKHAFRFAMQFTNGAVVSSRRQGSSLPAEIVHSDANLVLIPDSAGAFSWFNAQTLSLITTILFMLLLIGYAIVMARKFASSAKLIKPQDVGDISFDDIAGQATAKMELQEVVAYLKSPESFLRAGIEKPTGVLLVGPPGNGKTMMAKAIAAEAGVRFFAISGSDLIEIFVGVGPARVRSLFNIGRRGTRMQRLLRRRPGPCVIFIDEIDSVGGKRGKSGMNDDERERTLNQILVEIDGIQSKSSNRVADIVVIAATNRADMLDDALLRRLSLKVDVLPPDRKARAEIVKLHARKVPKAKDVDYAEIGRITGGFSGSGLQDLVQQAARIAMRRGEKVVSMATFREARDRIILGAPRPHMVVGDEQRKIIAVHEAGHAVAAVLVKYADPPSVASIIPHANSMGHVISETVEDEYVISRAKILAKVHVALAGRAAEEVVFGHEHATTGAGQDRRQAITTLVAMVGEYGLSAGAKHVSNIRPDMSILNNGNGLPRLSEESLSELDAVVKEEYAAVQESITSIIKANKLALLVIARMLLTKDTVSGEEIKKAVQRYGGREDMPFPLNQMLDANVNLVKSDDRPANLDSRTQIAAVQQNEQPAR